MTDLERLDSFLCLINLGQRQLRESYTSVDQPWTSNRNSKVCRLMRCKKWGQSNEEVFFFFLSLNLENFSDLWMCVSSPDCFLLSFQNEDAINSQTEEIMTYQGGRGSNPLLSKFLEISGVQGALWLGLECWRMHCPHHREWGRMEGPQTPSLKLWKCPSPLPLINLILQGRLTRLAELHRMTEKVLWKPKDTIQLFLITILEIIAL